EVFAFHKPEAMEEWIKKGKKENLRFKLMGSNAKGVSMNGFQELKNILLSAQSVNPLIGINLERRNNFF
ncbi:hypothetical protein CMI37_12760, partial [Candidatus Pacearchaeota archaeon]|nr:hypothetical protein [Candidatus Pacearchaeota archaeon]